MSSRQLHIHDFIAFEFKCDDFEKNGSCGGEAKIDPVVGCSIVDGPLLTAIVPKMPSVVARSQSLPRKEGDLQKWDATQRS